MTAPRLASTRIPIAKPSLGDAERLAVQRPLETGWLVQGPYVAEFERGFAERIGAPHAIATTSCTTALHLAVAALGLRPGDEVIVPAFTWVSTANVVEFMGARPVFCDIDLATFNIDVNAAAAAITERTVGIIPVHLFGLCADMRPLLDLARAHGLWIAEDAACAFGGWQDGKHAGTFGDAGCFSFHPRKSITTGEGGMVTVADNTLDVRLRSLRDHGASRSDLDRHTSPMGFLLADYEELGYNYRMTDIQGALGCAQLARADEILGARAAAARRYDELLVGLPWLALPVTPSGNVHGFQAYVTLFRPEATSLENVDRMNSRRNALMADLEARGISTRQGTHAPVLLGFYRRKYNLDPQRYTNAVLADRLSLALPLYADLSADDQEYVVDEVRKAYARSA